MSASVDLQSEFIDEITRQRDILDRERPTRAISTNVAFLITGIFLPLPIVVTCIIINVLTEYLLIVMQRDPSSLIIPWRYRTVLGLVFLLETAFVLLPAMLWHIPDTYVKAYAVGMFSGAMLHVAGLRAIHLPMGLAAAAAIVLFAFGSNTLLWYRLDDPVAMLVSNLCVVISSGYFISTVVSNYRLHREAARLRATAEAANAAKGRFLAQMSHELRTPLNGILGMGRAMIRNANEDETREQLAVMITSAEGLSTILDDILDMTAVEKGTLPIRPRIADPSEELTRTAALFQSRVDDAGLRLILTIDPAIPDRAVFDPQRLRQCVSNLLSNAIKFTEAGEVRIEAGPATLPDGGPGIYVEVSDTGPGIAPDQYAAIFEPFVKGATLHPKAGNGLGLSISRSLARRMGGDLEVCPAPAPGARFRLTVAAARPIMPHGAAPLSPGAPGNAPPRPELFPTATPAQGAKARPALLHAPDLAGLHALVVDDIATNRLVAAAYLQALGLTSSQAAGGEEALQLLTTRAFDFVLLDMNMPAPDGLETFRRIRALPGPAAQLPVLAMTADAMEEQKRTYLSAGLDGYVAKPISSDRLSTELRRVLGSRPNRKSPDPAR